MNSQFLFRRGQAEAGRSSLNGWPPGKHWWIVLAAILAVAAWLRVCNLGTFSLWLDEVFTMTIANAPLAQTLAASAADAENVPMYAVITNIGIKLGADEHSLRLAPIVAALASIVVLALWARRHFGSSVALITAAFCALSTFHIRYSQELRAYPYLLLVCTLTLLATDRIRTAADRRSILVLAAIVAAGCYSQLTYVLVLVPAAGSLLLRPAGSDDDPQPVARALGRFLLGISLGFLAFAPWIWLISITLVRRMPQARITEWTWEYAGSRWQVLTIAAREFEKLTWFGLILAGIALVGLIACARSRAGRVVILPALGALVAWELALAAMDHWTVARYDTSLWPFLAILMAVGFHRLLIWSRWRWLQCAVTATMIALFLVHIDGYYRIGRPHWDALAEAVIEVRRDGESVVTNDHWARRCLSYYLGERIATITDQRDRLSSWLEKSSSVLLVSRETARRKILNAAERHAEIAHVTRTAHLYRLQGASDRDRDTETHAAGEPWRTWPDPFIEPVSKPIEQAPACGFGQIRKASQFDDSDDGRRIEFDSGTKPNLRYGWSRPTTTPAELTVAWVLGREAGLDVPRTIASEARLTIRIRPHPEVAESQRMRLLINGAEIGQSLLQKGWNVLEFNISSEIWRSGSNLLILQFSDICCTAPQAHRVQPQGRPHAAAVDWIEVVPTAPGVL